MLCNMALQYDKVLDHMDGPYIFSMLLAFSGIFKITLVTVDQLKPLVQPSIFRYN